MNIGKAYAEACELFQQGRLPQADSICQRINQVAPENADAWHLRGIIAGVQSRPEDVEIFLKRAIRLKPEEPQFHYNLANAYQQQEKLDLAESAYQGCLQLAPEHLSSLRNLGLLYLKQSRFDAAEHCFRQAVGAAPNNAGPWMSLGIVTQQRGDLISAAKCFEKATSLQPSLAEAHMNLGLCLAKQGLLSDAVNCYRRALSIKPQLLEAKLNLGIAFQEQGSLSAAEACFLQASRDHPQEPEPLIKLGTQLATNRKPKQAIRQLRAALALLPHDFRALFQMGHAYRQMQEYERAADFFLQSHQADPDNLSAMAYLLTSRMEVCDWRDYPTLIEKLKKVFRRQLSEKQLQERNTPESLATRRSSSPQLEPLPPFMALSLPIESTAAEQLECARAWVQESTKVAPQTIVEENAVEALSPRQKLTLGYLSADFKEHPVSRLVVEMIELHDRNRFQVEGFSVAASDRSSLRARLESAFDAMHDCSQRSHQEIANLVRNRYVDILIDLTGFTQGNQVRVLAQRPAAIQVNYLGYPGTLGADFVDYIVVDGYVVPEDQQAFYSEQLVTLPYCYQVNDRQRPTDGPQTTRVDCGLPPEGFVFCCFNNNLKITPEQFASWMRILKRVSGSVLWLLQNSTSVTENLRSAARAHGVSPDRLRFAARADQKLHLSRHQHADLFLDTLPYNAHTTASDALWCGLPLVTRSGATFQSRVAGSLLQAVGLSELVAESQAEYEELSVRLATNPPELETIRQHLVSSRNTSPLWDTPRFTRDLETAYLKMWDLRQRNQPLQPIEIHAE